MNKFEKNTEETYTYDRSQYCESLSLKMIEYPKQICLAHPLSLLLKELIFIFLFVELNLKSDCLFEKVNI